MKAAAALNPLATKDQDAAEALALRLIERAPVRAAREIARRHMLGDPATQISSGRLGLERALDQWTLALAMRESNGDSARPKIIWNVDNTPRRWFGRLYPGAAVAVDNPDNVNREMPLDGASEYELHGRYSPRRTANFSLKLEEEPADHAGIGHHVFMLTTQHIHADADGSFRVTISPEAARGRINHIQTSAGRLSLYARDSFSDWTQQATMLRLLRTAGPPAAPALSEDELAGRIAAFLPAFVRYWSGFKNGFLDNPAPNELIGPIGREASWGFLAGGRYHLEDDEALIVTTTDGAARYTGFQVTNPWTIAPDPLYRQSSLNSSQRARNADGSVSYVVSVRDPGVHNWIDTVGLHDGWFLLRWQGLPEGTPASGLVRDCSLVKLGDLTQRLPAGCPMIDLEGRRRQIEPRAAQYALRAADAALT
jgi:hypothetical protein